MISFGILIGCNIILRHHENRRKTTSNEVSKLAIDAACRRTENPEIQLYQDELLQRRWSVVHGSNWGLSAEIGKPLNISNKFNNPTSDRIYIQRKAINNVVGPLLILRCSKNPYRTAAAPFDTRSLNAYRSNLLTLHKYKPKRGVIGSSRCFMFESCQHIMQTRISRDEQKLESRS